MHFLTAITLALATHAAPTRNVHQLELVKRGDMEVPFFFPQSEYETFKITPGNSFVELSPQDIEKMGRDEVSKKTGVADDELQLKQSYEDASGVTHLYFSRLVNGTPVDNEVAAVHIKEGQIVAQSASFKASNSFVDNVSEAKVVVSLEEAVKVASKQLGAPRDDFPASNVYVKIPSGQLVYAHQFQLRDDAQSKWYQVAVDAANGQVLQVVDYYQSFSYRAVRFPNGNPTQGFDLVIDPDQPKASPKRWHETATEQFRDTRGNNVDSRIGDYRPVGEGEDGFLKFTHNWDRTQGPESEENRKASVINNFYVSNMVHDITYQYGFNEAAGNFQASNFGRGGKEGDFVQINNQAPGLNNANFATPPDGQKPTMNMYVWDRTSPRRDGSLENSIPVHEYGHGISNRMTGGSGQANCLQTTESRGMGEGWSDIFAVMLERHGSETRTQQAAVGSYATENPAGIRQYPYSTDTKVNPLLWSNRSGLSSVHAIGTIWATILYEVYWNLVDKHGFTPFWFDATQQKGNIMTMQLVIGGLALQPCNPTFLTARDAILAADRTYYGGANQCLIWKAFAKRGLGTDATSNAVNGFAVPTECQ
jgi:extracellular elastinolytic metalloproteinase